MALESAFNDIDDVHRAARAFVKAVTLDHIFNRDDAGTFRTHLSAEEKAALARAEAVSGFRPHRITNRLPTYAEADQATLQIAEIFATVGTRTGRTAHYKALVSPMSVAGKQGGYIGTLAPAFASLMS